MWQLACLIPTTLSGHLHPPVKKRIAIQAAASSTMPGLLSPCVQEFSPPPAPSPCLPAQSRTTPCSSSPRSPPALLPAGDSQPHSAISWAIAVTCLSPEHRGGLLCRTHTHGVHSHHHRFRAPGEEGKTQKWDEVLSTFEWAVADPHWEAAAGSLLCPPCHVPPAPASPC